MVDPVSELAYDFVCQPGLELMAVFAYRLGERGNGSAWNKTRIKLPGVVIARETAQRCLRFSTYRSGRLGGFNFLRASRLSRLNVRPVSERPINTLQPE